MQSQTTFFVLQTGPTEPFPKESSHGIVVQTRLQIPFSHSLTIFLLHHTAKPQVSSRVSLYLDRNPILKICILSLVWNRKVLNNLYVYMCAVMFRFKIHLYFSIINTVQLYDELKGNIIIYERKITV